MIIAGYSASNQGRVGPFVATKEAQTPTEHPMHRELIARYDRPGPRYTSYPTANEFHTGIGECDLRTALRLVPADGRLSLYLHVPFCEERCLYCACNVIATKRREVAERYLEHLLQEIALAADCLGAPARAVDQLHLGGGTPTYFTSAQLRRLVEAIRARFEIAVDAELAIEIDPRVTMPSQIETLQSLGFRRFSMGVQDFDPAVQEAIGRIQSVEQTEAVVRACRSVAGASVNIDLIYGLPRQTLASFRRTLDEVIRIRPDRLAIYGFAFVPWLRKQQLQMPVEEMPTTEERLALLELARERLQEAGYVGIGIDHFALPDDELIVAQRDGRLSRNFMGYTVRRAPQLLAFGVSAISEFPSVYVQNTKKLSEYGAALEAGLLPVEKGVALSDDDDRRRWVIRELMCNFRVSAADFEAQFSGASFASAFAHELEELRCFAAGGFARWDGERLELTPTGQFLARNVAMLFDTHLRGSEATTHRFSRTV